MHVSKEHVFLGAYGGSNNWHIIDPTGLYYVYIYKYKDLILCDTK